MEIEHPVHIDFWHTYRSFRKSSNLQYTFLIEWEEESADKIRAKLLSGYDRTCYECQLRLQWAQWVTCVLKIKGKNCIQEGCCES